MVMNSQPKIYDILNINTMRIKIIFNHFMKTFEDKHNKINFGKVNYKSYLNFTKNTHRIIQKKKFVLKF